MECTPDAACAALCHSQRLWLFGAVPTCAGSLGAAALSPSRGRHQPSGKAGAAVSLGYTISRLAPRALALEH